MPAPGSQPQRGSSFEVLLAFLRLGCTSFGGPIAHLGYFRAEFVERRRWLTEASFAELVALSQSMPGPASSQTGFAIGLMRAGWMGGLAAWTGFTLPSAALMLLFAFGYFAFAGSTGAAVLHGLQLAAVAVVAQAVVSMQRTLAPDPLRLSIAALGAAVAWIAPPAYGTLLAIVAGAASGRLLFRRRPPDHPQVQDAPLTSSSKSASRLAVSLFSLLLLLSLLPSFAPVGRSNAFLSIPASLYRTGAMVFGGGHVVLPMLDAAIVAKGWLSQQAFLAGYGAAQAVPGPLFSIAAYIGAAARPNPHPFLLGVCGLIAIFLPGLLLMAAVLPLWSTLRRQATMPAVLRGINASVVGVLAAALYRPLWISTIHNLTDCLIAIAAFLLLVRYKVQPWIVVLGIAAASVGLTSR